MLKPENHVTRGMREKVQGIDRASFSSAPKVPEVLVSWLEENYPARCYNPKIENLETHLKYAGKVELIEDLRGIVGKQKTQDTALMALADDADPEGLMTFIMPREKE